MFDYQPTLLSAGCSLIYGAELSDSLDHNGNNEPSLKTWPALYANSKKFNYKTCAVCGISNQGIARYVIDSVEAINPDYVIVQWTFFNRYEIRLNNFNLNNQNSYYYLLNPYMSYDSSYKDLAITEFKKSLHSVIREIATTWYKYVDSDETEYFIYLKTKIDLANYLRWKKIPFVFTNSQNEFLNINNTTDGSLKTLIKLSKDIPELSFNSLGFYNWSKKNNFSFGINHPLDDAHHAAFEMLTADLDHYFQIKNF